MAKRQAPAIRLVSASQRRARPQYTRRRSEYNITDNFGQLPSVMKAREEQEIRRLQILKDADLHSNKSFKTEKDQLAHMAKCDAAIEAAERNM